MRIMDIEYSVAFRRFYPVPTLRSGEREVFSRRSARAAGTGETKCPPVSRKLFPKKRGAPESGPLDHTFVGFAAFHSMTLDTTPAPTVRPPSRMAKRSFSSIAIGAISSTSNFRLSPGITISVPSGSVTIPVTSVVRK